MKPTALVARSRFHTLAQATPMPPARTVLTSPGSGQHTLTKSPTSPLSLLWQEATLPDCRDEMLGFSPALELSCAAHCRLANCNKFPGCLSRVSLKHPFRYLKLCPSGALPRSLGTNMVWTHIGGSNFERSKAEVFCFVSHF